MVRTLEVLIYIISSSLMWLGIHTHISCQTIPFLKILTLLHFTYLNNLCFHKHKSSSLSQSSSLSKSSSYLTFISQVVYHSWLQVMMKCFLTDWVYVKVISQEKKKKGRGYHSPKQRTNKVEGFLLHKTVENFLQVLRLSTCVRGRTLWNREQIPNEF